MFQVSSSSVYTFDNINWSGSISTEAQEKIGNKPSTYIKGSDLDSLSFDVALRSDLSHELRTPDIFILGQKLLGANKWLLKSESVSDTAIDGSERMNKALLKLEFEEYVRPDKKKQKKELQGFRVVVVGSNIVPDSVYNPLNKAEDKRHNPNYAESIANFNPQNNMLSKLLNGEKIIEELQRCSSFFKMKKEPNASVAAGGKVPRVRGRKTSYPPQS